MNAPSASLSQALNCQEGHWKERHMVATVPNENIRATFPHVMGQKGDATHTLNMKCPVPSVSQTARCSIWRRQCLWAWSALCLQNIDIVRQSSTLLCLCQYSKAWSALCHQCHRQRAALSDDVNIYEHEVSHAFSVTESTLLWQCQCSRTWSVRCLQCHGQHAPLSDDVNVQEHEAPCDIKTALLHLTMSIFMNMKRPVPWVSQTACFSVWRCQCLQMMSCVHDKNKRERHPCHVRMCHSPSCPVSWSELTKMSPHSAQMTSKTSKYLPPHCPATVSDATHAVINLKRWSALNNCSETWIETYTTARTWSSIHATTFVFGPRRHLSPMCNETACTVSDFLDPTGGARSGIS